MKDYLYLIVFFVLVFGLGYYFAGVKTKPADISAEVSNAPVSDDEGPELTPDHPLKFKVRGSFEFYPDLTFWVKFKTPPADTFLKSLNIYNKLFAIENRAYTDTATLDTSRGAYMLYYDFQQTQYNPQMLNGFFEGIDKLPGSENIKGINVE